MVIRKLIRTKKTICELGDRGNLKVEQQQSKKGKWIEN